MLIEFTLNGKPVAVEAPPDITLLDLLRDYLGLTGAKEGCAVGECGACSVIMDGRLVNSCLVLAPQAGGSEIITIEGIHAPDGGPNDLQENFITYGAVQCGICIPGMVMAGEALLMKTLEPTRQKFASRWPATCAAAPATSRSWMRSRRRRCNGRHVARSDVVHVIRNAWRRLCARFHRTT